MMDARSGSVGVLGPRVGSVSSVPSVVATAIGGPPELRSNFEVKITDYGLTLYLLLNLEGRKNQTIASTPRSICEVFVPFFRFIHLRVLFENSLTFPFFRFFLFSSLRFIWK